MPITPNNTYPAAVLMARLFICLPSKRYSLTQSLSFPLSWSIGPAREKDQSPLMVQHSLIDTLSVWFQSRVPNNESACLFTLVVLNICQCPLLFAHRSLTDRRTSCQARVVSSCNEQYIVIRTIIKCHLIETHRQKLN